MLTHPNPPRYVPNPLLASYKRNQKPKNSEDEIIDMLSDEEDEDHSEPRAIDDLIKVAKTASKLLKDKAFPRNSDDMDEDPQ